MAEDVADVLILDGGTSCEVSGKHLATEGLSVVVLEQGHWASFSDFPGDKSANRYVIDGSVFTTSTGVNPTATICALAKRTATTSLTKPGARVSCPRVSFPSRARS